MASGPTDEQYIGSQGWRDSAQSVHGAEQQIADLTAALQEQRRRSTLMDAELFQLREAREDLEQRLAAARAEAETSQARRKEMARVIATRDARIQACYQEMATLERYILRLTAGGPISRFIARITGGRFPKLKSAR